MRGRSPLLEWTMQFLAWSRPRRLSVGGLAAAVCCVSWAPLTGCVGATRHAARPLAAAKGAILLHSQIRYPYSIRALKVGLDQGMLFRINATQNKAPLTRILRAAPLKRGCHTIGVWVVLKLKASPFGNKQYSVVKKVVFGVRGGRGQKIRIMLRDQGVMHSFYNRIKVEVEQHPPVATSACKTSIHAENYQFRRATQAQALSKEPQKRAGWKSTVGLD